MLLAVDGVHRHTLVGDNAGIGITVDHVKTLAEEPCLADIVAIGKRGDLAPVAGKVYRHVPVEVAGADNSYVHSKLDTGVADRSDIGGNLCFARFDGHGGIHDLTVGILAVKVG